MDENVFAAQPVDGRIRSLVFGIVDDDPPVDDLHIFEAGKGFQRSRRVSFSNRS